MKNGSRAEAIFTIGYDGARAVVDGQAMKRYGQAGTKELAEKGLFRAAWASALYSQNSEELRLVEEIWRGKTGDGADTASFDRLFGTFAEKSAAGSGKKRRPLIL